jgi:hypothetical protein
MIALDIDNVKEDFVLVRVDALLPSNVLKTKASINGDLIVAKLN